MSDDSERLCPLSHESPARSARGTVLCGGHVARTLETLTQLSTFDAEADTAAHDQTLSRKAGQPLSGDREHPLPMDARITEHRMELGTVLASWTLLVAEERKVSPPPVQVAAVPILGPICTACGHGSCRRIDRSFKEPRSNPLPALCRFLAVHHEWSVTRTWADDYAGEILALGRRAWSLLHPSGNRQFVVGRCLERDEVDGSPCPGEMWARLTPSDPAFEVAADLCCDTCDCTVPSTDWMKYGRRVMAVERENVA